MYQAFSRSLLLLILCGLQLQLSGQETFPYNGVYQSPDGYYAITGATIIPAAGETAIEGATLVIREGKIEAINRRGGVPAGAQEVDLSGHFIYPSFIDIYSEYGLPEAEAAGSRPRQQPQMLSNREGAYGWNEALKSDFQGHEQFTPDNRSAQKLRGLGFGTVISHQHDGISRGTSVALSLAEGPEQNLILSEQTAHHLSFRKGVSTQNYPSSLTGTISLLRQTYLDGEWYKTQEEETNLSLSAWNGVLGLPQVFEVDSWQDALRATRLGTEFNQQYILHTNGDSYQRLDDIANTGSALIVPLRFPKAFDLEDPYMANLVSLSQLRHWERAPSNPALVADAGIEMALTLHRLEKPTDFPKAIQKAIEHGLSQEAAFRALTLTPARLMGIDDQVGRLSPGMLANFLVADKAPLTEGASLRQNWVQGHPYVLATPPNGLTAGTYRLQAANESFLLKVEEKGSGFKLSFVGEDQPEIKHSITDNYLQFRFQPVDKPGFYRLSGYLSAESPNTGQGQAPNGDWISWTLDSAPDEAPEEEEAEANEDKDDEEETNDPPTYVSQLSYPNRGYGWEEVPQAAERVLIRNATVWTSEADGILENTDVLLENGKIAQIGQNLSGRDARIIDGEGRHLTAGIIDEHSHIAISRGVNEGSQSSTAEVRMGDVVDATDIDIYRQLAGGVTTSQLLHGSANPIGGQSAIIKLRWGLTPEEMLFEGADGFIKFALGENVKQSNWGDNNRSRFPQTRMGVEETFESYFNRAREYGQQLASDQPPRRDLDLEALLEVINGERFISCHSYQQGEITMLMRVAESFGFRVNTFTHILEGYKVADKMAEHGAGGSTFSDWWAYKYEVVEAIPHNADIMMDQGVVVAINSDDAEMGRRLNQEAGKSVLYGDMPEEDALKMVTLNPARLLHIDDQVGSIRVGKDADIVLWTDHPLSVYARAEYTFIDGIDYFNQERDAELRQQIAEERNALIQKSLDAKAVGEPTQPAQGNERQRYHCNSIEGQEDHGHEH
ncbi:MAG: amidohydrolase family protein [Bacteroidota bacterium]